MRMLFVRGACALIGLAVLSGEAQAQNAERVPPNERWSVSPRASYVWPGDLFRHEYTLSQQTPAGEFETGHLERLRVEPLSMLALQVKYRLTNDWMVGLDVDYGNGTFEYHRRGTTSEERVMSEASLTSIGLIFGRRVALLHTMDVELGLGAWAQRFTLAKDTEPCPPSLGVITHCGITGPWADSYTVPSFGARIELHRHIARRIGVELGATYSVGRADTKSFWRDLIPEFDAYEAPTTYWVHTPRLFGGVALRL